MSRSREHFNGNTSSFHFLIRNKGSLWWVVKFTIFHHAFYVLFIQVCTTANTHWDIPQITPKLKSITYIGRKRLKNKSVNRTWVYEKRVETTITKYSDRELHVLLILLNIKGAGWTWPVLNYCYIVHFVFKPILYIQNLQYDTLFFSLRWKALYLEYEKDIWSRCLRFVCYWSCLKI